MGQAKLNQRAGFSPQLVDEWERHDCVDFAVALSRVTGWLLHVDWWSTSTRRDEGISEEKMTPLRVYVADNSDLVFDARGVMSIFEFNKRITRRIIRENAFGNGGVHTRFYDEAKLASLPLRHQSEEKRVVFSIAEIRAHQRYLDTIPVRRPPLIPAHHAARFSYGSCAVFAEALYKQTGLQPTAILAVRFMPGFEGTRTSETGYFHSVVLHPDGMVEDSWGKAPLTDVARRFGVVEFRTSDDEHRAVVERIKRSSTDLYAARFNEAVSLIREFTGR